MRVRGCWFCVGFVLVLRWLGYGVGGGGESVMVCDAGTVPALRISNFGGRSSMRRIPVW